MDENTALAIIFANTRRRKRSVDLLTLAEAFDFLKQIYHSQEKVAQQTDLSREMVREFLKLLTLPEEIKAQIKSRKIDSIDTAYRLASIKDSDIKKNIVDKLSNSQTHDFRDVIRSIQENENLTVEKAKELVLRDKPKDIHFFIIDFTSEDYRKLTTISNKANSSPAELIKKIVEDWLSNEGEK